MRLKPVPEPPADGLELVADARRAVPLVPGTEDDCCARLLDRLEPVTSRDEARTWLTFLRALDLARETASGGFVRTDRPVDRETLAEAFRERVFGAREVLAVLDEEAGGATVTADEAFEAFEPTVPHWERLRNPGRWREGWRERVVRLLGWAVLLGLAVEDGDGFRATTA